MIPAGDDGTSGSDAADAAETSIGTCASTLARKKTPGAPDAKYEGWSVAPVASKADRMKATSGPSVGPGMSAKYSRDSASYWGSPRSVGLSW